MILFIHYTWYIWSSTWICLPCLGNTRVTAVIHVQLNFPLGWKGGGVIAVVSGLCAISFSQYMRALFICIHLLHSWQTAMALFLLIDMHCLRSTRNTVIKLTWHTIDIGFYVMSSEFVNKYMSLVWVLTTTTLNCYRNRSCYIRLSLTKLTHFYIIFIFICSVNTVTSPIP